MEAHTLVRNTKVFSLGALPIAAAAFAVSAAAHPTYEDAQMGHARLVSELDRNQYAENVTLLEHYFDGENHGTKLQMMAIGERRYFFQGLYDGRTMVLDVTDPMNMTVVARDSYAGRQLQLAYSQSAGRWILISSAEADDNGEGLQGVRIYDASDPRNVVHLADWSTDRGDPSRRVQEGSGTHRNYYDGGRYAYLDSQMDDEHSVAERGRANGVQIIDVEDPSNPLFVSYWWVPGMRVDEVEEYRQWREHGDGLSSTSQHGPFYVPERAEDGGRYGYSTWGSFGFKIFDLSDITAPKPIGEWRPAQYRPGRHIEFHGTNVAFLDRSFVITNPEPIIPHCLAGPWYDSYVIDVRDKANPRMVATLPVPVPPEEAPYDHFCDKRGRFGTHNMPHLKAPGQPHPDITAYTYFNGGLQFYDLSDPANPSIEGYFIPRQGGTIDDIFSYYRDADNVFIEWDRRLIWFASNTGLYLLSTPLLGEPILEPMPVREWAAPGVNIGFEEFQ
ncbi:MAG TPA: hypothetical protein VGC50_07115 [Gammaproteobacteria bacterium]|jgi:hypothetical protein